MLNKIISLILSILLVASIIFALVFLIWGGIDWTTSQGDKQKVHSAKQKITLAIVGLVVVFTAFIILNFIYHFFKIG